MKKLIVFAAIVILAGFSSKVMAQSATGQAAANLVAAQSVTVGTALNFGSMTPSAAVGTVIVDPTTNLRTKTGGVTLLTSGTPFSVGTFTANGTADASYLVNIPAGTIQLTSGSNNMTVGSFSQAGATKLDAAGSDVFSVGATLSVGANQPLGLYTGTYDVTVVF